MEQEYRRRRYFLTAGHADGSIRQDSVWEVGVGKQFSTISAAVAHADEFDEISVSPGVYKESLRLGKSVILRNSSRLPLYTPAWEDGGFTWVTVEAPTACLRVTCGEVLVEGFSFDNPTPKEDAITAQPPTCVEAFPDSSSGKQGSIRLILANCRMRCKSNDRRGTAVLASSGGSEETELVMNDCLVEGRYCRVGVMGLKLASIDMSSCVVSHAIIGVLARSCHLTISNSKVDFNRNGIMLGDVPTEFRTGHADIRKSTMVYNKENAIVIAESYTGTAVIQNNAFHCYEKDQAISVKMSRGKLFSIVNNSITLAPDDEKPTIDTESPSKINTLSSSETRSPPVETKQAVPLGRCARRRAGKAARAKAAADATAAGTAQSEAVEEQAAPLSSSSSSKTPPTADSATSLTGSRPLPSPPSSPPPSFSCSTAFNPPLSVASSCQSNKTDKEEPVVSNRCFFCHSSSSSSEFGCDSTKVICGRCKMVAFCSQECFENHWPRHNRDECALLELD